MLASLTFIIVFYLFLLVSYNTLYTTYSQHNPDINFIKMTFIIINLKVMNKFVSGSKEQ